MSRATSIAGVRPLGWLARLRALCSSVVWACPAKLLGGWMARVLRGWGQSLPWAWERAMIMRVSSGARPKGGADRVRSPRALWIPSAL